MISKLFRRTKAEINPRVIKTARTKEAINEAAANGYKPLVKPVIRNPEIHRKYSVLQNLITGQIEVAYDYRHKSENKRMATVIDFTHYYPHSFPLPYAAYLVPKDIKVGELVLLEDLIEDIIGSRWNQGDANRLQSCEAIWNGTNFIVQHSESNTLVAIG